LTSSSTAKKEALFIQFAKEPVSGLVKTRMQPTLSAEQACALHTELLLWVCRTLCESKLADVELWVSGERKHPVFDACGALGIGGLQSQSGDNLGDRMFNAISESLGYYQKVILVGSDCPQIDADYLRCALQALDNKSLVLGPAIDGGYVLIGATAIQASLFEGISWGTDAVFCETVQLIEERGIGWSQLLPLADIDRPEDLSIWQALRT
jgi:rSAM/selenodomain-associated transferase 1